MVTEIQRKTKPSALGKSHVHKRAYMWVFVLNRVEFDDGKIKGV